MKKTANSNAKQVRPCFYLFLYVAKAAWPQDGLVHSLKRWRGAYPGLWVLFHSDLTQTLSQSVDPSQNFQVLDGILVTAAEMMGHSDKWKLRQ